MTALIPAPAPTDVGASVDIDYPAVLRHLKLDPGDPRAQALVLVCRNYDLDPVLKHAVLVDGNLYITRDGLLHVAHASRRFDGIEVVDQGETDTHWTATVRVWRKDMTRPVIYPGRYPKTGGNRRYGPEMAIKTAECMALRRAFDVALSSREEHWDLDEQPGSQTTTPIQPSGLGARARRSEGPTVHGAGPDTTTGGAEDLGEGVRPAGTTASGTTASAAIMASLVTTGTTDAMRAFEDAGIPWEDVVRDLPKLGGWAHLAGRNAATKITALTGEPLERAVKALLDHEATRLADAVHPEGATPGATP